MEEGGKKKMTFTIENMGLYECNRMSFGLTNVSVTFQQLMECYMC